eukprot:4232620-Prymnesium_polylepis.2
MELRSLPIHGTARPGRRPAGHTLIQCPPSCGVQVPLHQTLDYVDVATLYPWVKYCPPPTACCLPRAARAPSARRPPRRPPRTTHRPP